MLTPVLLILAVFFHINGISCEGEVSTFPTQKQFCDTDAFVSSKPIDGKVFLFPYENTERIGDWYENSVYCAAHCAEMVTIDSAVQNTMLNDFMRSAGMANNGVWLGATVFNLKTSSKWYNGKPMDYSYTLAPTEHNEAGLTALLTGFDPGNYWGNWWLHQRTVFIACQRPENWKACEN